MDVRRLITGESSDGGSVFSRVDEVDPVPVGAVLTQPIWGWDALPEVPLPVPLEGDPPTGFFPHAGGVRVHFATFVAGHGTEAGQRGEASLEGARTQSPPGFEAIPGTNFHRTESVEIVFVVAGEIVVSQAEGDERTLSPGDCLIQGGAMHAWRNESDKPCVLGMVVIGASRSAD